MDTPYICPFCGSKPAFGLTKKIGCQMHGDPIQRVTLGCNNQSCAAKPMVTGGDRYANGETGAFFKKGEADARALAVKYWNTRYTMTSPHESMTDGDGLATQQEAR